MENESDQVFIEVEDVRIQCNKELLTKNSDYFAAMFGGNFIETSLGVAKLKDIDVKSFKAILKILEGEPIDIENIPDMLRAVCLLQFNDVKADLLAKLDLNNTNCVKLYKIAELLSLLPLWHKAKVMALRRFSVIWKQHQLLELDLDSLCCYLGNIYLKTDYEWLVFLVVLKWLDKNQSYLEEDCRDKVLFKLLNCVNFNAMDSSDIMAMSLQSDMIKTDTLASILKCVIAFKDYETNGANFDFPKEHAEFATHLLTSKDRKKPDLPCLLFDNSSGSQRQPFSPVLAYNDITGDFHKTFSINSDKIKDLKGFKLSGVDGQVYLYGGEYILGAGNWNFNFWIYDMFQEKWESRYMMPHGRRHFHSLIHDQFLYIIGGTGKYRVVKSTMTSFDFSKETWNEEVALPIPNEGITCCMFCDKVFIVSLSRKTGYFFNNTIKTWLPVRIQLDDELVMGLADFVVFSVGLNLFIKGSKLIMFKLEDNVLVPQLLRYLQTDEDFVSREAVLINEVVYTLYKYRGDECNYYNLEKFDLKTLEKKYVFQRMAENRDAITEERGESFLFTHNIRLFSATHFPLVEKDVLINEIV